MNNEREAIKELATKIRNLSPELKKEILEDLAESEFSEQQIMNLSFNKTFGVSMVMLMGQYIDKDGNTTLKAVQVDEKGRIITSK